MLRILARVGLALLIIWGLVAVFHTWTRQPDDSHSFFWLFLPYPVLIALTVYIVNACARNGRPDERGFSWFAVGLGAVAGIGLAVAVSTGLFSLIRLAYYGHVSLEAATSSSYPADPEFIAIYIAISAACYIWAGAISATLSPQRPVAHALAAGAMLLVWSCVVTAMVQPLAVAQLVAALIFPIPLAAWGARLQQARVSRAP